MSEVPLLNEKCPLAVAIDFDGTITHLDVVDGLLVQFAEGKDWIKTESEWVAGKISSQECLERQIAHVRVSEEALYGYLKTIQLDPGFRDLYDFLKGKGIPLFILSDGFDLLIRKILEIHGFADIPLRSNVLRWEDKRLIPEFPFKNSACKRCAHCKRVSLEAHRQYAERIIFIGDGLSDLCALDASDWIYAKGRLEKRCLETEQKYSSYRTLDGVTLTLPQVFDDLLSQVPGRIA